MKATEIGPIQRTLFNNPISILLKSGYLRKYDPMLDEDRTGEGQQQDRVYMYQDKDNTWQHQANRGEGQQQDKNQPKFIPLATSGRDRQLVETFNNLKFYRTVGREPALKFRINEDTESLHGRHSEDIVRFLEGTSVRFVMIVMIMIIVTILMIVMILICLLYTSPSPRDS